jgi:hypothetical protein
LTFNPEATDNAQALREPAAGFWGSLVQNWRLFAHAAAKNAPNGIPEPWRVSRYHLENDNKQLQIPLSREHWISPEHNLSIPRSLHPGLIRG